jgi:hypothetical protein
LNKSGTNVYRRNDKTEESSRTTIKANILPDCVSKIKTFKTQRCDVSSPESQSIQILKFFKKPVQSDKFLIAQGLSNSILSQNERETEKLIDNLARHQFMTKYCH